MKFNIEKCKVAHYGKRSIDVEYSLYGQPLEEVVSEKRSGSCLFQRLEGQEAM